MNPIATFASLPLRMAADIRARRFLHRDPLAAQREMLPRLIHRAKNTAFGRDHGFGDLAGLSPEHLYRRYCRQVPIRSYGRFWEDYFGPLLRLDGERQRLELRDLTWPGTIPWFCETSGTTAPSKFIPFTGEMFAANRRAALDMLACYLAAEPGSRLPGATFLYMAGPTAFSPLGSGVHSGDMSAITLKNRPTWLNSFVEPKEPLSSAPWEERLTGMARLLINNRRIRAISGVPPWILLLLRKAAELSGAPVAELLPHLELLIHGGASLLPYRDEFRELFPEQAPAFLELLPSSEAFMGFQVRGEHHMRLTPFYGTFFEFLPVEQLDATGAPRPDAAAVPLWEVEAGRRYALLLSTCAGLWRYQIGDTLRFLDTERFSIEFTGRDRFLDRFEEKVTQGEVEAAVAAANEQMGLAVQEFMVGPDIAERRHCWILACRQHDAARRTADFLDRFLMTGNADYAAFRSQGRIRPPQVVVVDEGLIYRWSHEIRGKLGGQSKIPHIDPTMTGELVAGLRQYAEQPLSFSSGPQ